MELLQMLTSQLGISEEQAKGGAGLLFKLAKDQLGSSDFGQMANAVPNVDDLISSAPEAGGMSGLLGGLGSMLGGKAGNLGALASLAGGFKDLNLDSDMIGKFVPVVASFLQEQGGDGLKGLLEKVMK